MIANVLIHLINALPIVVDLEALPEGADRSVRCTNVRTVDGKRPEFVHDRRSTFVFPLGVIRLIEVPVAGASAAGGVPADEPVDAAGTAPPAAEPGEAPDEADEEPDEDLLARIRSV